MVCCNWHHGLCAVFNACMHLVFIGLKMCLYFIVPRKTFFDLFSITGILWQAGGGIFHFQVALIETGRSTYN